MAPRCFIICIVLSLSTALSTLADDVFLSIDCGSAVPYKDKNGIEWVADDKYVQNGESRSVMPDNSLTHVSDTLRVFKNSRKKNCYHINSIQQGRVLPRASFFYGNYDGLDSPPTFSLHFDGNEWSKQVKTSSTDSYWYEVIYDMKKDSISLCVAQTKQDHFPFISSIAIRSLEPDMYAVDQNYPLFLTRRVAFASNTSIRYREDPYDRIWSSGGFRRGYIQVSSDAVSNNVSTLDDKPPPAVLRNAVTIERPDNIILLNMNLPSLETRAYINWYFSEVTQLEPDQTRYLRIYKDDKSLSDPIQPPYGGCTQIYSSNITVSSNTKFSLVGTDDSTLPPLINAMEVFVIGDKLTNGTTIKDIEGLASLQKSFSVLRGWSGDPCLPSPYTWDWIQCNDDPMPRVTALLLSDYGLSGLLPDFSAMNALQTIDLHNNSLQGSVPDFLGALPNLKTLDVGSNQFNGTIPASLSTKNGLNLTLADNPLQLEPAGGRVQFVYPLPPPTLAQQSLFTNGNADNDNNNGGTSTIAKARKRRRIMRIAIPPTVLATVTAVMYGAYRRCCQG